MQTLFEWLIGRYPSASRQTLRRMVADGRVSINGLAARSLKIPVGEGDRVVVAERRRPGPPTLAPLEVIHEDDDVLVVNKPAGLLTSTVARERRPTAIAVVRRYLACREPRSRPGVVHRLDRDASGLLVFTKNDRAFASLKRQFFHHSVDREYLAVVHGRPQPPSGRIQSLLSERPDGTVKQTRRRRKARLAVTEYELIHVAGRRSVLRLRLFTGRKHQIRAQLASRGWPVAGDSVYGPQPPAAPRLLLAATLLAFDHPRSGQRLSFTMPPPPEIQAILDSRD